MENIQFEEIVLQPCPNCGSVQIKLNNSRTRFWYECDGDCWTQGNKCLTQEEAAKSWNSLKPRPKKTNFELLQETGIANFATFMRDWEETHNIKWSDMTEDEIIIWLNSEADSDLESIVNF